uniref:Uncharacterized protein n=1 Tax=Salmo trutta TaxID=8032 RepID=A0A674B6J1_SALTR
IPGTFPTRLTTILSLLFPVRTFTALLIVMLSRLIPFTSTNLSPTQRPPTYCSCGTAGLRPTRQSSSQPMLPSSPSTSWR